MAISICQKIKIYYSESKNITLEGHFSDIYSMCFSSDGEILASGSDNNMIILWNCNTVFNILNTLYHPGRIVSLCFSTNFNHKVLVSCSSNKTIKIWDCENNYKEIITITETFDTINQVCFSPYGEYLVSGSSEGNIKIYDCNNFFIKCFQYDKKNCGSVKSLCFSLDNKYLVVGYSNGSIRIFNINKSFKKIISLRSLNSIISVCLILNDNTLIVAYSIGTIEIWNISFLNIFTCFNYRTLKNKYPYIVSMSISNDKTKLFISQYCGKITILNINNKFNKVECFLHNPCAFKQIVCFQPEKYDYLLK